MNKLKLAESLLDKIEGYVYELEEDTHDVYYDDYILDELLEMREVLHLDGSDEGRRYQTCYLSTDQNASLYDVVNLKRALSGEDVKLKIMAIDSVKLSKEEKMLIEFLGKKIN